jgi:hypothetical protein
MLAPRLLAGHCQTSVSFAFVQKAVKSNTGMGLTEYARSRAWRGAEMAVVAGVCP